MSLTAQENDNLKQGGAPHMMQVNSFYYSCAHSCPTLSYSKTGEEQKLQPVVTGMQ